MNFMVYFFAALLLSAGALADVGPTCINPATCASSVECCGGFNCNKKECKACKVADMTCRKNKQCCTGICTSGLCAACALEGDTCSNEKNCCTGYCTQGQCTGPPPPPIVEPPYAVCITGEKQTFGAVTRRPTHITVHADGRCVVANFAGGFDGYFSVDAGDSHEMPFDTAVAAMIGETGRAVIGPEGKRSPANKRINTFLRQLRDLANPRDLDIDNPEDKAISGAVRKENIDKISNACTELISVSQCDLE